MVFNLKDIERNMSRSGQVNMTLDGEEATELNREQPFTEEGLNKRMLRRYSSLLSKWADGRIEMMRPSISDTRQTILMMSVLDKAFARLAILLFIILGWCYFLTPDVERVTGNWHNITSNADIDLKFQIEVVSITGAFFIASFAYTALFHGLYVAAVEEKSILYLTWQFFVESFILLGKLYVMYQFCLVYPLDPNVISLGIIPVGYQVFAQIILATYLWNIYRGNQMLIDYMNLKAYDEAETAV